MILFHIETVLSALIAVLAWYNFRNRSRYIRLIGLVYAVGSVCNLSSYLFRLIKLPHLINLPASVYDFIMVVALSVAYSAEVKPKYRHGYTIAAVLCVAAGLWNVLFLQKESLASYNKLLSSFIVISYAILFFFQLIRQPTATAFQKLPMFWCTSGFLLYHSGTVFLFAFNSYLINAHRDNLLVYWSFHNVLSIVSQCIVLLGIFTDLKKQFQLREKT